MRSTRKWKKQPVLRVSSSGRQKRRLCFPSSVAVSKPLWIWAKKKKKKTSVAAWDASAPQQRNSTSASSLSSGSRRKGQKVAAVAEYLPVQEVINNPCGALLNSTVLYQIWTRLLHWLIDWLIGCINWILFYYYYFIRTWSNNTNQGGFKKNNKRRGLFFPMWSSHTSGCQNKTTNEGSWISHINNKHPSSIDERAAECVCDSYRNRNTQLKNKDSPETDPACC